MELLPPPPNAHPASHRHPNRRLLLPNPIGSLFPILLRFGLHEHISTQSPSSPRDDSHPPRRHPPGHISLRKPIPYFARPPHESRPRYLRLSPLLPELPLIRRLLGRASLLRPSNTSSRERSQSPLAPLYGRRTRGLKSDDASVVYWALEEDWPGDGHQASGVNCLVDGKGGLRQD